MILIYKLKAEEILSRWWHSITSDSEWGNTKKSKLNVYFGVMNRTTDESPNFDGKWQRLNEINLLNFEGRRRTRKRRNRIRAKKWIQVKFYLVFNLLFWPNKTLNLVHSTVTRPISMTEREKWRRFSSVSLVQRIWMDLCVVYETEIFSLGKNGLHHPEHLFPDESAHVMHSRRAFFSSVESSRLVRCFVSHSHLTPITLVISISEAFFFIFREKRTLIRCLLFVIRSFTRWTFLVADFFISFSHSSVIQHFHFHSLGKCFFAEKVLCVSCRFLLFSLDCLSHVFPPKKFFFSLLLRCFCFSVSRSAVAFSHFWMVDFAHL